MSMQKRWCRLISVTTAALLINLTAFGLTPDQPIAGQNFNQPPMIIPPAPNINAKAFVLMDAQTGTIIASKNMNEKLPPASLTKLMTLYLISSAVKHGQIGLNDKVRISEKAWRTGGSKMFVKVGERVSVIDLIHGIIVDSGNDACVAMAQYIAGTEQNFTILMNRTAAALGMTNTHYTDATGLPHPDHYSDAHDLAILTRAIINNFPEDYKWYKKKWFTFSGIRQPNRNRLLWRDPSVDGLKTGHTKEAGYCLIASGLRDGTRLIAVVMGTPTDSARANDSEALLNYGFRFYKSYELYAANTSVTQARAWLGAQKYVKLGVLKPLYITAPIGQYKNLKAKIQLQGPLKAPIKAGQAYGTIDVYLQNKLVSSTSLVALSDDNTGGFWRRMSDHIALLFHHWL